MNNNILMSNALLSSQSLRRITNKVNSLFQSYETIYEDNVDSVSLLFSICKKEGIIITEEHLSEFNGETVSGFIKYKDESKEGSKNTIVLSNSLKPTRKLFTLAHELGHYFLHKTDGNKIDLRVDIENPDDPKEREANEFAGQLLIPEQKIREILNRGRYIDNSKLYTLSYAFKVSEGCMKARLYNLGYRIV